MNQRAPAFPRAVYAALAIVVLLGVVAFASRGHNAPGVGSGGQRGPVQYLFDIVKYGGAPIGRPGMPGFEHLSDEDIAALIRYVRTLTRQQ